MRGDWGKNAVLPGPLELRQEAGQCWEKEETDPRARKEGLSGSFPEVLPLGNELENSEISCHHHHHQPSLRPRPSTLPCPQRHVSHPQFGHLAQQGGNNSPFVPATALGGSAGSTGENLNTLASLGGPAPSLRWVAGRQHKLEPHSDAGLALGQVHVK